MGKRQPFVRSSLCCRRRCAPLNGAAALFSQMRNGNSCPLSSGAFRCLYSNSCSLPFGLCKKKISLNSTSSGTSAHNILKGNAQKRPSKEAWTASFEGRFSSLMIPNFRYSLFLNFHLACNLFSPLYLPAKPSRRQEENAASESEDICKSETFAGWLFSVAQ